MQSMLGVKLGVGEHSVGSQPVGTLDLKKGPSIQNQLRRKQELLPVLLYTATQ